MTHDNVSAFLVKVCKDYVAIPFRWEFLMTAMSGHILCTKDYALKTILH
jgi:hypothetical protein